MTLEIIPLDDAQIVLIPPRLDAGNAPEVEAGLKNLLAAAPRKMILDFSKTDYVASAGLRVLLVITRDQMKAGRKISFVEIHPQVLRVFDMAGFTSIFPISRTRTDALEKMA